MDAKAASAPLRWVNVHGAGPPDATRHSQDKLQMASCCSARGQRTRLHGAQQSASLSPPSRLTPRPQRAAVGNGLPLTAGVRPPFKRAGLAPPGSTQPAHFQSRLTSQNKKWRDGEEAKHEPAAQLCLSGSCLALTFEAMGTLLKEQMLTDVQAQEHGNYTSG